MQAGPLRLTCRSILDDGMAYVKHPTGLPQLRLA